MLIAGFTSSNKWVWACNVACVLSIKSTSFCSACCWFIRSPWSICLFSSSSYKVNISYYFKNCQLFCKRDFKKWIHRSYIEHTCWTCLNYELTLNLSKSWSSKFFKTSLWCSCLANCSSHSNKASSSHSSIFLSCSSSLVNLSISDCEEILGNKLAFTIFYW